MICAAERRHPVCESVAHATRRPSARSQSPSYAQVLNFLLYAVLKQLWYDLNIMKVKYKTYTFMLAPVFTPLQLMMWYLWFFSFRFDFASIFNKEFNVDSIFSPPIFGDENINSSAHTAWSNLQRYKLVHTWVWLDLRGCKTHSVTSCIDRRSLYGDTVSELSQVCSKKIAISIPFNFP